MSDELTTEQIADIKARRAAVSEEPLWEASTDWHWDVGIYSVWVEGRSHFTTSEDATEDEMKAALVLAEADAVFIANAPDDIDLLIADNERLRARVMELESLQCEDCPRCDGWGFYDGSGLTCEDCDGTGCKSFFINTETTEE